MIDVGLLGKDLYVDIGESIEGVLDIDLGLGDQQTSTIVHINTTAYWNERPQLIGEKGHIYVYTDCNYVDEQPIPGLKVGDGMSYLIDNPFVASNQEILINHINNHAIHISPEERYFWNNKVRCDDTTIDGENITFTKN